MSRSARLCLALLLATGAAGANPGSTAAHLRMVSESGRAEEPERGPERSWSFRAGAPLRAAAGAGEGHVAVGTSDGYVHLLRADGSYRWSFTVKGAVVAPPVVGARGTVYVATSTKQLYALRANGTLAWKTALAGVPLAPLLRAPDGAVLIAADNGLLYAVTPGGRMRTAVAVRERLTAPPALVAGGHLAAGGERGTLFVLRGFALDRSRRGSRPLLGVAQGPSGLLALADDGQLHGPGPRDGGPFARLGCSGSEAVVVARDGKVGRVAEGGVEWLSGPGEVPSAPPACLPDGRVLLPYENGDLGLLGQGAVSRVGVAQGALFTPLFDASRDEVVVSSADGRIVALPRQAL